MITYVLIVVIAPIFDYTNGMNDAANSIATVVATRVLSPRLAVVWAAAFFFETNVARRIGRGIVHSDVVTPNLVLAALLGAIVWMVACIGLGLPISVSHSLIGRWRAWRWRRSSTWRSAR